MVVKNREVELTGCGRWECMERKLRRLYSIEMVLEVYADLLVFACLGKLK